MANQKPGKMQFEITWKVAVFAIVAFIVVRIAFRLLENLFQLGMSDMFQAILTGIIGTLATFVFARKKVAES